MGRRPVRRSLAVVQSPDVLVNTFPSTCLVLLPLLVQTPWPLTFCPCGAGLRDLAPATRLLNRGDLSQGAIANKQHLSLLFLAKGTYVRSGKMNASAGPSGFAPAEVVAGLLLYRIVLGLAVRAFFSPAVPWVSWTWIGPDPFCISAQWIYLCFHSQPTLLTY